jgi:type II secretory pathway component GspD/PulD (secretin)/tetratricopeptide (TPR) repeat protein
VARASTVAWISVAVGIALAPVGLYAQAPALSAGPIAPPESRDQAQSRPARVHDALRMAMDAYRRGDYELAATYFQQAKAGQEDLTPAERQDLTNWLKLNGTALQARRDGARQIRLAEEAARQGRNQEALTLIKGLAPNQQFLTAGDKLRLQRLTDRLMPGHSGSGTSVGAASSPTLAQARSKLTQARMLLARGNYDAAQALAREAERLNAPYQPGEDSPQKVMADIARARAIAMMPADPKALLTAARNAYEQGKLDDAERLAKQADQASTMWSSIHLWGDSPSKVLRDIAAARAKQELVSKTLPLTPPATPLMSGGQVAVGTAAPKDAAAKDSGTSFTSLKTFMGKSDNTVTVASATSSPSTQDNTEKARQLLKQARQALQAGNVAQAKQLGDQARGLKPELNWWEDTPDKLAADMRELEAKKHPVQLVRNDKTAAEKSPSQDPRSLLRQARELYNAGKLEESQKLAQKASMMPSQWGLFEDSPEKLLQDLRKARLKRDQEEAVKVLAEARKLYEQGKLDDAERQAHRAERLHGPYSFWDLGDRPQKLLVEIDTARTKNLTAKVPGPAAELAKKEAEKKTPEKTAVAQNNLPLPVWPETKKPAADSSVSAGKSVTRVASQNLPPAPSTAAVTPAPVKGPDQKAQAKVLLAEARQLQKAGKLVEARQKALEAQRLGAKFGPDEDRPELVLLALSAVCQKRIENLVQQASDHAAAANGNPVQYRRAETELTQARQLAVDFHLDTQLIDSKMTALQHTHNQVATPVSQPAPKQIAQMQYQGKDAPHLPGTAAPAVARSGDHATTGTQQHGRELLDQARMELRAGQNGNARRLAEAAFSGPYGVQEEAAQVLRSIDAEEFNQRMLAANRSYDAAMEAYDRHQYPQAASMLRSVDAHLLTPDKQARLKEVMLMPGMQPTAVVQAGLRNSTAALTHDSASSLPGKATATDTAAPPAGASASAHPEADFAKQVEAMQEVKFQKLRADGLAAQSEAMRQFQAGETDRALEILQDYNAGLRDSGLGAEQVALLERPIDNRLHQLKTLKHQRDFEKLQASKHDTAVNNISRVALQEQAKKEQMAELMKKYNTLFKEGKYKEAEMYAMRAKELDPDDPVPAAAIYTARTQANLTEFKDSKKRREDMFVHSLNEAEDPGPAVDTPRPLILDPAMTLLSKNRKPLDINSLTTLKSEKERVIQRRLEAPISTLDYKDTPLKQILDDLQVTTGVNIVPDEPALNEAGISLDKPVTMKLEGVALKSALNLLLHQVHLTYVIGDEVLKITTEDQARGRMEIRTYQVIDLILPVPDSNVNNTDPILKAAGQIPADNPNLMLNQATPFLGLNSMAGPSAPMSQSQMALHNGAAAMSSSGTPTITKQNPKGTLQEELIRLIMNTIAPQTWRDMGGQGTIDYYPLGGALVVTQTPDIQEQVADLLGALRRLQDQQVAIEIRFITISESFFERIGVDFNINIVNNQTKYNPQIVSQQFQPFGFINAFTPQNFVSGLTPGGSFTQDLAIPINTSSFNMAVPPFGAFPNLPGGNGGISMGLAYLSDIQVYMLLEAAQGDERSNVMQAPKLTLFNGQTSTINVSDTQFFVTSVTVVQLGGQVVFVPSNMPFPTGGVTLSMTAVISADRRFVRMDLAPNLTNLTSANVQLYPITTFITPVFEGGAVGQPVPFTQFLQQPVFNTIGVQTSVNVPDGGTVLLGGLKRLSEGRNEFGPPILSEIPYINRLFKNVGYGRETESLLMMVTPRIIINEEEEQRQVLGTAGPVAGGGAP